MKTDFIIGQKSFTQKVITPEGAGEDFPEEYPRLILKGGIPEWLQGRDGEDSTWACHTQIEIYLTYKGTDAKIVKQFQDGGGRKLLTVEVLGTTLQTKEYATTVGVTEAETVPEGLAGAFYDAVNFLQTQGRVTINAAEVPLNYVPGKALRVQPGDHVGMIQSVSQDVMTGNTTLEMGPCNLSLSPGDWLEYQRSMVRSIQLSYAEAAVRTSAKRTDHGGTTLRGMQQMSRNNVVPNFSLPDLFLLGRVSDESSGKVKFLKGVLMNTKWDTSDTDPKPSKGYEEISIAETELTLTAGDKVYVKATLSKTNYSPKGPFSDNVTVSLSGTFEGSEGSVEVAAGGVINFTAEGSAEAYLGLDHSGLFVEPKQMTVSGLIDVTVDCGGGGTSGTSDSPGSDASTSGAACDCTCTASATHDMVAVPNEDEWPVSGIGAASGPISMSVSGSVAVLIDPFTPTGKVTISPATLTIPSEVTVKVSVWECTAAELVKENEPESTDEIAYIGPIAEAVTDGDGGFTLEQRHVGLVFWNSPPAIVIPSDAGGSGP